MEAALINWSPLWISLQTAITTIIIVFFLGTLTAWWVLQQKNEVVKIIADGIFISAAAKQMNSLEDKGLIASSQNLLPTLSPCYIFPLKNVKIAKTSSGKM
ncbi:MAG: hypothetical protein IIV92_04330 [Schwartzia sp.]|nr:hypothetical protein [Schwartzia sp. (in: firmicutes)]